MGLYYRVNFINRPLGDSHERSQYIGKGYIQLNESGLIIQGRHNRPFLMNFLIGFPVFCITYYSILFLINKSWITIVIGFIIGCWLSYFITYNFFGKKQSITVPWHQIDSFSVYRLLGHVYIGVFFQGYRHCSPIAFEVVYDVLQNRPDIYGWHNIINYMDGVLPGKNSSIELNREPLR